MKAPYSAVEYLNDIAEFVTEDGPYFEDIESPKQREDMFDMAMQLLALSQVHPGAIQSELDRVDEKTEDEADGAGESIVHRQLDMHVARIEDVLKKAGLGKDQVYHGSTS